MDTRTFVLANYCEKQRNLFHNKIRTVVSRNTKLKFKIARVDPSTPAQCALRYAPDEFKRLRPPKT